MSYTHSNLFLKNVQMMPVIPANMWKLKSVRDIFILLQAKSNQETEVVTHVWHKSWQPADRYEIPYLAGQGGPDCRSSLLIFQISTARHAKEIRNAHDDANDHSVHGRPNMAQPPKLSEVYW